MTTFVFNVLEAIEKIEMHLQDSKHYTKHFKKCFQCELFYTDLQNIWNTYYSTSLNKFLVKPLKLTFSLNTIFTSFISTFTYQTNLDYWMTIKTCSLLFLIYYINFSKHFVSFKLTTFVGLVKKAAGWNTAAKTTTAVLRMKSVLSTQLLCFHLCPDVLSKTLIRS